MKQTRQAAHAIKRCIILRCLWVYLFSYAYVVNWGWQRKCSVNSPISYFTTVTNDCNKNTCCNHNSHNPRKISSHFLRLQATTVNYLLHWPRSITTTTTATWWTELTASTSELSWTDTITRFHKHFTHITYGRGKISWYALKTLHRSWCSLFSWGHKLYR